MNFLKKVYKMFYLVIAERTSVEMNYYFAFILELKSHYKILKGLDDSIRSAFKRI
jgi:hypothetical protein